MSGPFFRVTLRLLGTHEGGRGRPIFSDYRPSWNLGNTWHGAATINDGRVFLEDRDQLAPGLEGPARIEPLRSEFWGRVVPGAVIAMQEGSRVVGYATIREIVSRPDYWTPDVAAFVDQARQFCDFVENAGAYSLEKRLAAARQRLLELYEAGSKLPHVDPPDGIEAGETPAPPEGWPGFGKFDAYDDPVGGDLSDDVLDVRGDLQRGLALWDRGEVTKRGELRIAAIWEWRFHFENHWGDHAIDALRALHRACGRT